jgi:hypothetical protein
MACLVTTSKLRFACFDFFFLPFIVDSWLVVQIVVLVIVLLHLLLLLVILLCLPLIVLVWEHFTKVEGGDLEDLKSQCNYCKKLFSCHSKRLGTSSMLTHLKSTCKKYLGRFDKSQSKLSFEVKKEGKMSVGDGCVGNMVIAKYNATKIRLAISKMIIKVELPFRFVETETFQEFMNTLSLGFKFLLVVL